MTPDEDPGWPRGISLLAFLVPGMAQMAMRRARGEHGLLVLRRVLVTFSMSLVLIGVVLVVLPSSDNASVFPWLLFLVGLAIVSLGAGRLAEKPLDCTTDASLADTYRTRFFLRIAFAESIAMFAFVFTFIGAVKWIYFVGGAIALVRFWTAAAPTRASIAQDQQELNASGCTRSLVGALRDPPPPRRR